MSDTISGGMSDRFDRFDKLYAEFCQRHFDLPAAMVVTHACIVRGLKVDMFRALELLDTMSDAQIFQVALMRTEHLAKHDRQYTRQEALGFLPDRMVQDLT